MADNYYGAGPYSYGMAGGAPNFGTGASFLDQYGAPIIGAVGSIGSAWLQGRAANNAQKASSASNAAALAFEREKFARDQQDYTRNMAMYEQQWRQRQAMRDALLSRYLGGGNLADLMR